MQTLVLRVPDDLAAELEEEARKLNSLKSEVARTRLVAGRATSGAGFALLSDLVGAERGRPADLSARKKHYLKARSYGRAKPGR